eukprot:5503843-Prymnesium_polylepis.1
MTHWAEVRPSQIRVVEIYHPDPGRPGGHPCPFWLALEGTSAPSGSNQRAWRAPRVRWRAPVRLLVQTRGHAAPAGRT